MIFRLSPIGAPYGSDGARLFRGGQLGGDARHVASQLRMPFKTIPLAMSKSRVKMHRSITTAQYSPFYVNPGACDGTSLVAKVLFWGARMEMSTAATRAT